MLYESRKKIIEGMHSCRPWLRKAAIGRWIPIRLLTNYIIPFIQPGERIFYDSNTYWDHRYRNTLEFSDGETITPDFKSASRKDAELPLFARCHYNCVENSIIDWFIRRSVPNSLRILDIGSGAGHWIDFYKEVFHATHVTAIDTSLACCELLSRKYAEEPSLSIQHQDISSPQLDLGRSFDIINAIGVIFHIVDDKRWRVTISNLAKHLRRNGIMIIGGHFGWHTQDVQFSTDEESHLTVVYKRIRSLRAWRVLARDLDLRVAGVVRTRVPRGIRAPHNNVLFLEK